jgi:hypothetical protein
MAFTQNPKLKTQNSKLKTHSCALVLIEHALNLFRVLRLGERDS